MWINVLKNISISLTLPSTLIIIKMYNNIPFITLKVIYFNFLCKAMSTRHHPWINTKRGLLLYGSTWVCNFLYKARSYTISKSARNKVCYSIIPHGFATFYAKRGLPHTTLESVQNEISGSSQQKVCYCTFLL